MYTQAAKNKETKKQRGRQTIIWYSESEEKGENKVV
jgi:hypothetical protein